MALLWSDEATAMIVNFSSTASRSRPVRKLAEPDDCCSPITIVVLASTTSFASAFPTFALSSLSLPRPSSKLVVASSVVPDAKAPSDSVIVTSLPPAVDLGTLLSRLTTPVHRSPSVTVLPAAAPITEIDLIPMVVCAKASPAPSPKTTPNSAIHFNARQLPLAKIVPVRTSQSPL